MAKPLILVHPGQSKVILRKLYNLANNKIPNSLKSHSVGETLYTRIMLTFLCRHYEVVDTILYTDKNLKPFPYTVVASLVRCLFELHLNAKYISLRPKEHSEQYLEFYNVFYANREKKIDSVKARNIDMPDFVKALDTSAPFNSSDVDSRDQRWSKRQIRDMAIDTDEIDEYDLDYPILSAYAHGDIIGSLCYLDNQSCEIIIRNNKDQALHEWLLNRAAQYFTCFLQTFSKEFNLALEEEIMQCWEN